jgi:hypothetical protein
MLGLDILSTEDLEKLRAVYQALADQARRYHARGSSDIGTPDVATMIAARAKLPLSMFPNLMAPRNPSFFFR